MMPVLQQLTSLSCKTMEEVEQTLLSYPQVSCPVYHKFSPGLYIRELFMPAGTLAIGHEQIFPHFNVMLSGKVLILNEDGTTTELIAPLSFSGKPGRKIGYVLEDMVWQNIYPTQETDVETLEATYLNKNVSWQTYQETLKQVQVLQHDVDRLDYLEVLKELGVTHEEVLLESQNELDQFPISLENKKVCLSDSPIQGKGIFATAPIESGEVILLAKVNGLRTQAGRYTNHSKEPNAKMMALPNGDICLVAIRKISGCYGGSLGEEITIDYRQAIMETRKSLEVVCQQYI